MSRLAKGLLISQIAISALCLVFILLIWLSMHIRGQTFSNEEVYYANVFASIPLGLVFVSSIIVLVKLKGNKISS